MIERSKETKAVKKALIRAGLPVVSVWHGRGTARGWLNIRLLKEQGQEMDDELERRAIQIAQEVTGREGAHNGRIYVGWWGGDSRIITEIQR